MRVSRKLRIEVTVEESLGGNLTDQLVKSDLI